MNKKKIKKGLKAIFDGKKIIDLKKHRYVINPLTDHEPYTTSSMLKTAIESYFGLTDFSKANKLIGEEDRGGFLCSLMSYKTSLPFGLVKWNPSGYEGQKHVNFRNAYTHGKMFLNGIKEGDKIIIVEDIIDTGGTIIALIELIRKMNVKIIDVIALAAKAENNGVERILEKTGIMVKVGCYFTLKGDKSKVVSFSF